MNADAEHLISYLIKSPWIVVLIALGTMLAVRVIRTTLRNRRERQRAQRAKEYWRRKFESELPEILNRNRQFRALSGPQDRPLLDYRQSGENASFVLSSEVLHVNQDSGDQVEVPDSPEPEALPSDESLAVLVTDTDASENSRQAVQLTEKPMQRTTQKTAQEDSAKGTENSSDHDSEFDVFNLPLLDPNADADSDTDFDELYDRKIRIAR